MAAQLPDMVLTAGVGVGSTATGCSAYQRLCGFAGGDVLPHTYPHVLGFPLQVALMADRTSRCRCPGWSTSRTTSRCTAR